MRLGFGRDVPGFSQIRLRNVGQRARDALRTASARSHAEDPLSCLRLPASAVFTRQRTQSILCQTNVPKRITSTGDGNPSNPFGIGSKKRPGDVIAARRSDGADPVAVVVTRERLHEPADSYPSGRAPANSTATQVWMHFN